MQQDAQLRKEAVLGWEHWFKRYPQEKALAIENGWEMLYSENVLNQVYLPNSNPLGVFIWIQYQLKAAKKANYAKSALPTIR